MNDSASYYNKPFTSVPEQVDLLRQRGMDVGAQAQAEDVLRRYGYYRLSGYTHYYRRRSTASTFIEGSTLLQVEALYQFDDRLRSALLEGIALVEVALRFHVGHRLGRRAPFAHRIGSVLDVTAGRWVATPTAVSLSKQAEWIAKYDSQEKRSQEAFVQHFRRRYGPRLPVWVATEVMSFGTLTELFTMMPENDRKLVAAHFGVITGDGDGDAATLSKWLNHIRHVRNICAHHSRLWNKTFDVVLMAEGDSRASELQHLDELAVRKLYGTLCAVRFLLSRIDSQSRWYMNTLDLVTDFARRSSIPLRNMGFPTGWQSQNIWEPVYKADRLLRECVDAINSVDVANRPEAMELLYQRSSEADRKGWLRYLHKRDALIGHSLGPQTYYPTFQFDGGNVRVPVADVNEHLFKRIRQCEPHPTRAAVTAQRWWLTVSPAHGFESPPMQHLSTDPQAVVDASRRWSSNALAIR